MRCLSAGRSRLSALVPSPGAGIGIALWDTRNSQMTWPTVGNGYVCMYVYIYMYSRGLIGGYVIIVICSFLEKLQL